MKSHSVGAELFHADGRTDRRTDTQAERHDDANIRLSQFFRTCLKTKRIVSGASNSSKLNTIT